MGLVGSVLACTMERQAGAAGVKEGDVVSPTCCCLWIWVWRALIHPPAYPTTPPPASSLIYMFATLCVDGPQRCCATRRSKCPALPDVPTVAPDWRAGGQFRVRLRPACRPVPRLSFLPPPREVPRSCSLLHPSDCTALARPPHRAPGLLAWAGHVRAGALRTSAPSNRSPPGPALQHWVCLVSPSPRRLGLLLLPVLVANAVAGGGPPGHRTICPESPCHSLPFPCCPRHQGMMCPARPVDDAPAEHRSSCRMYCS